MNRQGKDENRNNGPYRNGQNSGQYRNVQYHNGQSNYGQYCNGQTNGQYRNSQYRNGQNNEQSRNMQYHNGQSNDGQYFNGQNNGQYRNGQYHNGQYQNGQDHNVQHQNGQKTGQNNRGRRHFQENCPPNKPITRRVNRNVQKIVNRPLRPSGRRVEELKRLNWVFDADGDVRMAEAPSLEECYLVDFDLYL
ncbi:hypothetical protein N7490_002714 [Penicillium lividum]|nr:hypothetical protein N7490_002714 [Penicillium lividum]